MDTVTAIDLRQKLESATDMILINTLGTDSFRAKRIPGSINIPAGNIMERAEQVLPDKEQEIIVYCGGPDCSASPKAARKLSELGYTNVYDFEGGLTGWLREDLPLKRKDS
jgi:rhodanese-related sulfurtransferase